MEEKIKKLFLQVMEKHDGNKSNAAASLGVNNVTFWSWVNGKRGLNSTLCSAIDHAGGVLLIPGDEQHTKFDKSGDIDKLQAENAALRAQVADLSSQLKFAEKILRPEPKEKAPEQEASAKDAEFYLSSGTEGE